MNVFILFQSIPDVKQLSDDFGTVVALLVVGIVAVTFALVYVYKQKEKQSKEYSDALKEIIEKNVVTMEQLKAVINSK